MIRNILGKTATRAGLFGLLALCLMAGQAFAAISPLMVFEVQTGGSDANNSGGFRGGAFIGAPTAPTVTGSGTGGTVAAGTYFVVITYTDGLGETVVSTQTAVTVSGATSKFTVTSPAASTGALTWSAYSATTTAGPYWPISTGLTIGSDLVRTTTPPTSGTQPRGVDYSQATGRQVVIDNSTITATTAGANSNVLTFTLGHTAVGVEVGNTLRVTNGTNVNLGDYEITAVTPTTWTVTGATNLTTAGGAGSAIVGGMGGCHASPGQAFAFAVTSNTVYVKNGTYTVLNGTSNTAGNKFSPTGIALVGYSTNRNPQNTDTAPVFDAGAASMTIVSMAGNFALLHNVSITNSTAKATVTGWTPANGQSMYRRVSVTGCAVSIGTGGTNGTFIECSDSGCGGMGTQSTGNKFIRYVSASGTGGTAINPGSTALVQESIVTGQAGTASVGIAVGANSVIENSIAVANTAANTIGINANGTLVEVENCIVSGYSGTGATGYGGVVLSLSQFRNCADWNNTVAYLASSIPPSSKLNCVALSGDPFTNAAGNDYSLNTTAGAGAACRAAGIPGTWPGLSTTGYRDIGAAQHADPAGGVGGKKAGPGGGKVGLLDRPFRITRKAG